MDGCAVTPVEVREVIRQVLDEERERTVVHADDLVLKTISTILTSFGIDEEDRKEVRLDFQHLRRWRKSVERVETVGWGAAITILVSGLLGALWLGVKQLVAK